MAVSKKKIPSNMILRNGIWHLRMRVPARYKAIETKNEIHRTLGTGDLDGAIARMGAVKQKILAELDAKLAGRNPGSANHFEAMAELATSRNFSYWTADEIQAAGADAIMDRVLHLISNKDTHVSAAATALLGGVERPSLTISEVAEKMHEWYPEKIKNKAAKAKKTWKAQWTRPASKVVSLLGYDPVFHEISRSEAVALRDALKDRVIDEDMLGKSAQKELRLLNTLWERFHDHLGVDEREMPPSPFYNLGKGFGALDDEDGRKLEVPVEIIMDKIVAPGALHFMNDELRDITYVLVETGARQSEITDIPPHSIFLDDPIPHIWIGKETGEWAREVKNKPSKRKIPLVGVALEAFRRHPEGFPRYRYKGTYSAAANKVLHENNILPENVTIGGLRHAFETRMGNIDLPNDKCAEMMGHSVKKARGREQYGDDMPLEKKLAIHEKIMFTPREA
ncbi:DUF6538 domain-containing protein [Celeribacter sp. PS-C1]|uniref:DUF6538 domain-containing protein n=1 Tax=Celeribacter sp. PS-C1 TaxID=2820813 RepID=UPI001CA52242|nr:DUF6538 domain-containing protein [Celeribacter sp. PS-C1]MBW6419351.1 hypothetical protein [Celeribacter sp. PS-C1]